jgi:glycosyltransferase involved in cell wall biosynthesis
MAALEASAMRVPVVAAPVTGLVDAVQEGVTGLLVKTGHPAALAGAIDLLFRDPALRRRMGEAGPEFVTEEFSSGRVAEYSIAEYRQI